MAWNARACARTGNIFKLTKLTALETKSCRHTVTHDQEDAHLHLLCGTHAHKAPSDARTAQDAYRRGNREAAKVDHILEKGNQKREVVEIEG